MKATRLEKLLVLLLLVVAVDLGRRVVLHYTEQSSEQKAPAQVILVQQPNVDKRPVAAVPAWSNPPLSSVRTPSAPVAPTSPMPRPVNPPTGTPPLPENFGGNAGGLSADSSLKRFDLGSRTIGVEFFAPGAITMIASPDDGTDPGDGGDGSTTPP